MKKGKDVSTPMGDMVDGAPRMLGRRRSLKMHSGLIPQAEAKQAVVPLSRVLYVVKTNTLSKARGSEIRLATCLVLHTLPGGHTENTLLHPIAEPGQL